MLLVIGNKKRGNCIQALNNMFQEEIEKKTKEERAEEIKRQQHQTPFRHRAPLAAVDNNSDLFQQIAQGARGSLKRASSVSCFCFVYLFIRLIAL